MSQDVDFEQLSAEAAAVRQPGGFDGAGDLRRLSAVPVDLSVEIGRARMSVGETLELREGSVVTLDRMAGEPVDLLVNGILIARGEVVVIDEQFGLRLTQVLAATAGAATIDTGLAASVETGAETLMPEVATPVEAADQAPGEPVEAEPVAG
ncbi:MAG: flagellar motor switch protein FliN [Solirubrobacteraceae bacterium]